MENAREFANRLVELLQNERHAMAEFLIALAAFDRRNLYRELGHASLFSFLRVELKLSAGAAQYRKTAAELVQRFPEVEAALRDGRLCFSAVIQVAKVLTPENCAEVLPRFFGLSARDAAFVAVAIRPVESPPRREVLVPSRPAVATRTVEVPRPAKPDTITAELTRALFARSGGRCEWRFESGERCNSPVLPEQDHVTPSALGGPTTLEGMRILCRPHNDLAARRVFGDRWMNRFTGKGRKRGNSR
jgi:hypothetical protein